MPNQFKPWQRHEDQILRINYGKKTYGDMSKMLHNRSKHAVKNRCKVIGIQGVKKLWTDEELEILKLEYANNPHICDFLPNWSWESIKHKANQMNLKVRYGTYKFNHNFFNGLTEKSAYIAGFIAADGYLNLKANRIELAVGKKDSMLLKRIAREMGYTGPIYEKPKVNAVKLQITSQKLLDDLFIILGVKNNKSLMLKDAAIPPHLMSHFIRGYFDGDGTIKSSIKSIRFLGTKEFLEWIDLNFRQHTGIPGKKPKRKGHENVFMLGYYGMDFDIVCDWMYIGATIYLERKYQRYVKLMSEHKRAKRHAASSEAEEIVDSTGNSGSNRNK